MEQSGLYYDPLYGYISLPPHIRAAIKLPIFQRLRRLKQLSSVDLVFPGATHTRFEHSVGVFYLAHLAFMGLRREKIENKRDDWPNLSAIVQYAVQLAALFHDVGHGPFSHYFEEYFKRHPRDVRYEHETITRRLITEGIGQYNGIPKFLNDFSNGILRNSHPDPEELSLLTPSAIADIIDGRPPNNNPTYQFLSEIVHSEIDVDRLDYLQRDFFHIGLASGNDPWEILHSYTLFPETSISNSNVQTENQSKESGATGESEDEPHSQSINRSPWRLGLPLAQAEAVEMMFAARDAAYRKVYYNPTNRCFEELIVRAIRELVENTTRVEDLFLKSDEELIAEFERGGRLSKYVADCLHRDEPLKNIPVKLSVDPHLTPEGRRKLKGLISNPRRRRGFLSVLNVEEAVAESFNLGEKPVIFDIWPAPLTKRTAYEDPFLVSDDGKAISLIQALPHLSLTHKFSATDTNCPYVKYTNQVSMIRVYFPNSLIKNLVEEQKTSGKSESQISNEVIQDLEEKLVNPFVGVFYDNIHGPGPKALREKLVNGLGAMVVSYL